MDKLIFMAAQAAKATMNRQENIANNLANVGTTGFKAELMAFRSAPVFGEGGETRAFGVESTVGFDSTAGQLQATGRDMDVGIQGDGWFAITAPDGNEAYTRNGSFNLDAQGNLVDNNGYQVLGTGGPINVPPAHRLSISDNGTVNGIPAQGGAPVQLGQLKLVNPAAQDMVRGDDGFFRLKSGDPAEVDANVRVASGFVESSNVNPVEAMVAMIEAQRSFEMQTKMISSANDNGQSANKLFGLN